MNDWMPIETAPKLPTVKSEQGWEKYYPILLYKMGDEYAEIGGYIESKKMFYTHTHGCSDSFTHWMPLPKPPSK